MVASIQLIFTENDIAFILKDQSNAVISIITFTGVFKRVKNSFN